MPHEYAKSNAENFKNQLHEFLRIPSVSTLTDHAPRVQEAAEWLAQNMQQAGIENIEILPTNGHPVVYGDWLHAGDDMPTIIIYGHYDVQPAEKSDGWDTEPFEPVEKNNVLYARGSSDDKGQLFIHVKAVESVLKTKGRLPVNVKFIIEGEEEIGSPNLPTFLENNKDKLKADLCIISDTGMHSEDQPSIIYALRGLVALEVNVQGPAVDLHSGGYGGAVHNPIQALAEIIAGLHDDDGHVTVPGFYDDVLELSPDARKELAKTDHTPDDWKKVTGIPQVWGESQFTIGERISARPTLEINGIAGGFYGDGIKTVLPSTALAKITCRLVANQDPNKIYNQIAEYIKELTPPTITSSVKPLRGSGHPAFVDIKTPAMKAAMTAYEKGWGKTPIFTREGGSIPIVADFQQILGTPVILMGYSLNNNGAHGPNENLVMSMFHKGIDTAVYFLDEIATI